MHRSRPPKPSPDEQDREELSRHFDVLGRHAHDVVLLIDAEGTIVQAPRPRSES